MKTILSLLRYTTPAMLLTAAVLPRRPWHRPARRQAPPTRRAGCPRPATPPSICGCRSRRCRPRGGTRRSNSTTRSAARPRRGRREQKRASARLAVGGAVRARAAGDRARAVVAGRAAVHGSWRSQGAARRCRDVLAGLRARQDESPRRRAGRGGRPVQGVSLEPLGCPTRGRWSCRCGSARASPWRWTPATRSSSCWPSRGCSRRPPSAPCRCCEGAQRRRLAAAEGACAVRAGAERLRPKRARRSRRWRAEAGTRSCRSRPCSTSR